MVSGCQKTQTIDLFDSKNSYPYNLPMMENVKNEFDSTVDKVFEYNYSSLPYHLFLNKTLGIDGPKEPIAQIASNCFKSQQVQIQRIINNNNSSIDYQLYTPIEKTKNCIIKESNSPINADALIDLNKNAIYKEYSDNPFLRDVIDKFKSDGVITIKEYMDIIQIIIKLDKAGKAVQLEQVIKNL